MGDFNQPQQKSVDAGENPDIGANKAVPSGLIIFRFVSAHIYEETF